MSQQTPAVPLGAGRLASFSRRGAYILDKGVDPTVEAVEDGLDALLRGLGISAARRDYSPRLETCAVAPGGSGSSVGAEGAT